MLVHTELLLVRAACLPGVLTSIAKVPVGVAGVESPCQMYCCQSLKHSDTFRLEMSRGYFAMID